MSRRGRSAVALAALVAALAPASARGFCRTTTREGCTMCARTAEAPLRPEESFDGACADDPIVIAWPTACAPFAIDEHGSRDVAPPALHNAITRAFSHWERESSYLRFHEGAPVDCRGAGHEIDAQNANAVFWEERNWDGPPEALALTQTFFRKSTGEILGADISVNGVDFRWNADARPDPDADPCTDVEATLTHEAGHFAGLAHSRVPTATLYPAARACSLAPRSLSPDDIEAIEQAYPAARSPGPCTPEFPSCRGCKCGGSDGCGCRVPGGATPRAGGEAVALLIGCAAIAIAFRRGWSGARRAA